MRKILLSLLILLNIQTKAQCWKTVAAGVNHTVALKTDNTLWAWGSNMNGQLGDGTTITKNKPIQIGTTNNWEIVVAGDFHTVAIKTDGTLWAWGDYGYRELDVSSPINRTIPTQVGADTNWKTVAGGGYHTVAIKTDGTLWTWGDNTYGQLGDGTKINKTIPIQIGTANNWQTISAGTYYTIAIKTDGTLWSWGFNAAGQLGDGTFTDRYKPTQIGTTNNWKTISHTFAIKTDGTLWGWGPNSYGQLGDGTNTNKKTPTQIGTAKNWQTITAGNYHTAAIKTDGTLWASGQNYYGELGDSTTIDKNIFTQIDSNTNWKNATAGNGFTLAIKTDNTLFAWGFNNTGKLGDGTTVNKNIPTLINCPEAFTATTAQTNLNFTNDTSGSASITSISGGTAPYTYLWSNGATKNSITGLKAGDYSCTITDATSLSITKNFTITTQLNAITFTTKNINDCNNNNGSLTVTATGGTAPYQYAISPNFIYQSSNIFSDLSAGNYTIIVKDTNGFSTSNNSTSSITNAPPPTVATTQSFNTGATVTNLQASGANIKWYNTITGGTALSTSTLLQTTKYYASQTVNGCESTRTVVDIIITSVPTSEQIPTYVSTNGLIAYFPFKENANDIGPYNFKSITNNITPVTDRFQNNNSAYSFNGISSDIHPNISNYPQEIKSYTITGWFKANSPQLSQEFDFSLLNFGNIYPDDWLKISFYRKGYLNIKIGSNTFQSQENYFNDKWTFFAITFDYNTNTFALYINNLFKLGGNINPNNTTINPGLRIGKNQSNNNYFEGSIDDIGIWNRVLTAEEITNLYNSNISYTLIPDINFEKRLIALGIDSGTTDGKVLTSNISSLISLDVSFSLITDLTGIQDFTSLKSLSCRHNKLSSLDLSKNTDLRTLSCSNNQLTSLDVSASIDLNNLLCSYNSLTNLDVSKNLSLNNLDCSYNQLSSLDISKNINLMRVLCSNNKLESLNLKNGNNQKLDFINYIVSFKDNPNLGCIQVDNKVYSEANWSNLKDAIATYSDNCPPQNILISKEFEDKLIDLGIDKDGKNGSVLLSKIINIKDIDLSYSKITNLSGIEYFMNLEQLVCKGNLLSTIDLSKNTALKYLDCSNNPLTNLDVSKNLALTDLESNNLKLKTLDVSTNTSLLTLRCNNNQLTTLNITKNKALKILNCYSNQLPAIDVSNNIALDTLKCNSNKLVALDVSKNINLKRLDCSNNKLTSLNLKNGNNLNLEIINSISRFNYNPDLFCIQVDNKAYSDANWSNLKDVIANYSDNCPPQNILISSEFEDKLIALGIDKDGKNGSVLSSEILNVKSIDVSNSGISNLSGIEYFMNLESLICKGNSLSTIDLSKNTLLKYLDCSNNPLTTLDVSKNILLVELYCDGGITITNKTISAKNTGTGRLTALDISNNLFLTKLSCSNNQIINLDLSKNMLLTSINCSNNNLQNLNLKNGKNTKILNINSKNNSSLYCIGVDNLLYSNTNWTETKDLTARFSEDCDAPLVLPSNNFTIESKGETCLNQNNGEINIVAKAIYNYVANINGTKYPLINNSLKVANLAPATYNVSIGITGELFEQNYTVTIPKGATITAKSTIDSRLASVEISEGTAPYTVFVNGEEQFETASDTFSVSVNKGDFLEVKTAKACEGIYLKEIDTDLLESVLAHPNPTNGKFEIEVPISVKKVVIDLYTIDSKIISKKTYTPTNGRVTFNIENQASGVYIAKIYLSKHKYLKIIKK